MGRGDLDLMALLAKAVRDLQQGFHTLSKEVGPTGKDGVDGKDGLSIAGADGKDGRPGRDGRSGADGKDGRNGVDGKDGQAGAQGPVGPAPRHKWTGTKLAFEKPDGKWGKSVDLKGPAGGPANRPLFAAVGGGVDVDSLPAATNAVPDVFLVMQGGVLVRATFAQVSGWIGSGSLPDYVVTVTDE